MKYSPNSLFQIAGILAIFLTGSFATAQQLSLHSTLHSIGYQVVLPSGYDTDLTVVTEVRYRETGGDWQPGFPASRTSMGEFWGSLFQLEPGKTYELELSLIDSFPVYKKDVLTGAATTRTVPVIEATGNLKWVAPGGSGSAYTESNPGNLKTLLSSGLACGTTVLLKGGHYYLGGMTLNLTQDCPEGQPITIMAAQGEQPVLDGGSYETYTWTQSQGDPDMWWTTLPSSLRFNALCLVDGERMYPYAILNPASFFPGYPSLKSLGFDLSGFYRGKDNKVYIKTLDHKNINNADVLFAKEYSCLRIKGNKKNVRLRIKGIQFRYYGKGTCDYDFFGNPTTCYPSYTLTIENASNVVVDGCSFDFCNFPVEFTGKCNNNIVMNCNIVDGTGYWSHAAFKTTRDQVIPLVDPSCGTYGRYLENIGISFRFFAGEAVHGNIVWKNNVQGVVDGISLGKGEDNPGMIASDISENHISWCFDGLVIGGEHRSTQIWGNDLSYCPIGTSLITQGQRNAYIFRNVFHHMDQRKNHMDDPNFVTCENVKTHESWTTALKLNAGEPDEIPTNQIYFMHNTVYGIEPYSFSLYLWQPNWKVLQLRNNIFYTEGDATLFFDGVLDQPSYSFESVNNDVVNLGSDTTGIIRPMHGGQNACLFFEDLETLSDSLAQITGSPDVWLNNPLNLLPHFADPEHGDFHLPANSPLIDKGVLIPGFNNDFSGAAPEVGAFETIVATSVRQRELLPSTGLDVFPNPSAGNFFTRFSSPGGDASLQIRDMRGRLVMERQLKALPSGEQTLVLELPSLPSGVYFLKIIHAEGLAQSRVVVQK